MFKAKKSQAKTRPTADIAEPDGRPSEGYLLRLGLEPQSQHEVGELQGIQETGHRVIAGHTRA